VGVSISLRKKVAIVLIVFCLLGLGLNAPVYSEVPDEHLNVWVKLTNGNWHNSSSISELDSVQKNLIDYIVIDNGAQYSGFALDANSQFGHGEIISAPIGFKEPLFGCFIKVWVYAAGQWHRSFLTDNTLGVDFRDHLQYEVIEPHISWRLFYNVSNVVIQGRQFDYEIGITVNLYEAPKIDFTFTPHDSYSNIGFEFILLQNPSIDDFKITDVHAKSKDGFEQRTFPINQFKDLTEIPNWVQEIDFMSGSYRVHTFNFEDFKDASHTLYSPMFQIDEVTFPNNNSYWAARIGSLINNLEAYESFVIDPFLTTSSFDPPTNVYDGDYATNLDDLTVDSDSVGASAVSGYWQDCENDIVDNDGWTYSEDLAGMTHSAAASADNWESTNSFKITTPNTGSGAAYAYKSFAFESDDNLWVGLSYHHEEYASTNEKFYLEIKVTSSGTDYYVRYWLGARTCPSDTGTVDYINLQNGEDLTFAFTDNVTARLSNQLGIDSFEVTGADRPQVTFYVYDDGSYDMICYFDAFWIQSDADSHGYFGQSASAGNGVNYHIANGLHFKDANNPNNYSITYTETHDFVTSECLYIELDSDYPYALYIKVTDGSTAREIWLNRDCIDSGTNDSDTVYIDGVTMSSAYIYNLTYIIDQARDDASIWNDANYNPNQILEMQIHQDIDRSSVVISNITLFTADIASEPPPASGGSGGGDSDSNSNSNTNNSGGSYQANSTILLILTPIGLIIGIASLFIVKKKGLKIRRKK
jgi:hypothetical protein